MSFYYICISFKFDILFHFKYLFPLFMEYPVYKIYKLITSKCFKEVFNLSGHYTMVNLTESRKVKL